VVDDLAVSLRVVDEGLKLCGLEVDALTDGESALQWLEREAKAGRKYDVVLVDKGMAGLDGEETLRRMKQLLGTAMPTSVLLVQRDEAPADKASDKPTVASTVLFKPFAMQALHDALQRALGLQPNPAWGVQPADSSSLEMLRPHAGQRVLLVEDNQVNQEVAVELLRSVGLVVDTAGNGLQAVDRVMAQAYDLVLMDVQMPYMDGMAATRVIRERLGRGLPILAMTANAFAEERAACLDSGMNDHVVKPVDPKRLYEALARWLPAPGIDPQAVQTAPIAEALPQPTLRERLARLPGIDLAWALRNTGGSLDILERVMAKFVDRYRNGKPDLQARGADDPKAALRAACHSLRGACGAIGASELMARIESLEGQLDASTSAEAMWRMAGQLNDSLRALVLRLQTALAA
jgi:CheY-like chemotaxis protein/HPt (histidine-containing phosphotransfer) domain-containing protein